MTDLRQAAQQALEALEGWEHCDKWVWPVSALEQSKRNTTESLAALRTALEQQAEPSQWRDMVVVSLVREGIDKHKARELADHFAAQQQAEPVGMRMPKVGDKVICLEDESFGEVVSLTGGGSPDINFDDGTRGTYLLREFAELFGYVAPPQQQAEPPPEWLLIKNILDEYGLDAIAFVAAWKAAQQQAEPVQKLVAWGVFDGNLHDMFFTEEEAQEMVRLKGDGSTVGPLYTTPPQRPWVGLEPEDLAQIEADEFWLVGLARAIEAKLKEKNT